MTNLIEKNNQLSEINEEFIKAQEEYSNYQLVIDKQKAHLYMLEEVMGLKNAEMRDGYVTKTLESEGMLDKMQEIKNNFYRLKYRRDLLLENCKNLRIIEANK